MRVFFVLWVIVLACVGIDYIIYTRQVKKYEKDFGITEESLSFMSEHDDLTGLYRRHAALEHLSRLDPKDTFSVIMMDVDQFKEINDVYGHDFGDKVLVDMAGKIKSYTTATDEHTLISRYGSDEFVIAVLGKHIDPDGEWLNNLRELIHRPLKIGLANIVPTVSIGIAYSDGKADIKEVLIHADIAVAESKRRGRKTVTLLSQEMEEKVEETHEIKKRVYNAINNDELYMVYQPKVDAKTCTVKGYEALVRMKDSSLSPAVFIPIAEENGWLRQIGRMTTEKTIKQIAEWRDSGHKIYPVSVNYSAVQIRDTGYLDFVLEKLNEYHLESKYFEIEITEGILIEHTKEAIKLVERLHGAGIRVLLDDFGTGYSSLSYLSSIPLDAIKVDKSFVDEYLQSKKKMILLHDVIRLGHDLDDEIIVEGVETHEQFVHLKSMGADTIQGYVFSKPLMADEAINFTPSPE
jgi:diguanylate cyclase (GGDEF)-like protein